MKKHWIYFQLIFFCSLTIKAQELSSEYMELNKNWEFSQVGLENWKPASVPGTVHTDLLQNEVIEDPFYRTNERDQQWIDKVGWIYRTTFNIQNSMLGRDRVEMVFHGLDTYADVFLNGQPILSANNMFRTWQKDVKPYLQTGENTLKVVFHSPVQKGLEELKDFGLRLPATNDQSEVGGLGPNKISVFTRKAGYHYGWDWGPRFVTSGIWRPIEILAWDEVKMENIYLKQLKVNKKIAEITAAINLEAVTTTSGKLTVENITDNVVLAQEEVKLEKGVQNIEIPFAVKNPRLWWSNGLGEPNMYDFKITLETSAGKTSKTVRTGLRDVRLVRKPEGDGETFYFQLNGVKVFAKGANYIPSDVFLPRISIKEYRNIVADAAKANMNMLRVWGGGIYENDEFYELCDEMGIMIWQDFMFACAMYPDGEAYYENVKQEAIDNVVRLRNHPSIALWCGNNEINTAWSYYKGNGWGWKARYTAKEAEKLNEAYLTIFHEILPTVVSQYTDGDGYWPSSPQASYKPDQHASFESTEAGDIHYWGVWHGLHPFADFNRYLGRFMSEYGFQSFPTFEAVNNYTIPEDWDIESEVMAAHQRSGIGNLRIKEYMGWYYDVPEDFAEFLYKSQVLQAYGMRIGIEAHRRNMPHTMGSLYWQLNDCWPAASWASTDYYRNWKALHYAVRDAFEPVMISAEKNENGNLDFYVVSDKLEAIEGQLEVEIVDFNGKILQSFSEKVSIDPNNSTQIWSKKEKTLLKDGNPGEVLARVNLTTSGKELANYLWYFVPPKDLGLKKPDMTFNIQKINGTAEITLKSNTLVKDLMLYLPEKQIHFSENFFDVIPGETYKIKVETAMTAEEISDQLRFRHLNPKN